MKWNLIKTAPTEKTVLVCWAESSGHDDSMGLGLLNTSEDFRAGAPMTLINTSSGNWWVATTDDLAYTPDPTHWMPLPEPPSEGL